MNIVITGGTGSLGSALVARYYNEHHITVISRDGHRMAEFRQRYPLIDFYPCDIGDEKCLPVLQRAFKGNNLLIHAAAYKIVGEGFYNPDECERVNVTGSRHVADTWQQVGGQWAIAISSDKARAALTTYGASKKMMEGKFRSLDFSVVCYGNVVTSKGSFLTFWKEAIEQGQPIRVVPDSTRFCMTMDDAVNLVDDVAMYLRNGNANGIFIPTSLKGFRVGDVADATGAEQHQMDIAPYEKQHEVLLEVGMKVEPITKTFGRVVVPYNPTDDYYYPYRSDTCQRMTGQEVLELAKWH